MFQKDEKIIKLEPHTKGGSQTTIDSSVLVEGNFKGDGDIIIDGKLKGTVRTKSFLKIGSTAELNADIRAQNAVISGKVVGKIQIQEKLEILSSANIHGDISTNILSIESGAVVNGAVVMGAQQISDSEKGTSFGQAAKNNGKTK